MAEQVSVYERGQVPPSDFELLPVEQLRKAGRGIRIDPRTQEYYEECIKQVNEAVGGRLKLPMDVKYQTMKNRLTKVAKNLGIELMCQKQGNYIAFWLATEAEPQPPPEPEKTEAPRSRTRRT